MCYEHSVPERITGLDGNDSTGSGQRSECARQPWFRRKIAPGVSALIVKTRSGKPYRCPQWSISVINGSVRASTHSSRLESRHLRAEGQFFLGRDLLDQQVH